MTGTRITLSPEQVGDVGQALLTLVQEVSVLADRVYVLERVLEAHGLPGPKEVDAFAPSALMVSELDARAHALVSRVVSALAGIAPSNPPEA